MENPVFIVCFNATEFEYFVASNMERIREWFPECTTRPKRLRRVEQLSGRSVIQIIELPGAMRQRFYSDYERQLQRASRSGREVTIKYTD